MRKLTIVIILLAVHATHAQSPCSDSLYRQFDFWLGDWEVFAKSGNKAGDSRITLILDSCIILEEWESAGVNRGIRYAGKSFNTYNRQSKQWQQTWVDNVGGATEYLKGERIGNTMVFETNPFWFSKDTLAIRRLSFYNQGPGKVRQHGQISKDSGITWNTEYDLEYRRRNNPR